MSASRYHSLAARLLEARHPHRARAEALVQGARSPEEAWRSLQAAGLAPETSSSRLFRAVEAAECPRCKGRGRVGGYSGDPDQWEDDAWTCGTCASQGFVPGRTVDAPSPPSVRACVELADPDRLAAAERLALQCSEALVFWGRPAGGRIVWQTGGPLPDLRWSFSEALRILDFADDSEEPRWKSPAYDAFEGRASEVGVGAFFAHASRHARGDGWWRRAVERGARVQPSYPGVLGEALVPEVAGRPFADLPSPFDPALSIWELGCAPVAFAPGSLALYWPASETGR